MELSTSWEATSCAATQELPNILFNSKAHFWDHMSPPVVPILSQLNPIYTSPSYRSMIHFNVIHPLLLGLPSGLFPYDFPNNILYEFLFTLFVLHALHISFALTLSFLQRVQVMKLLIMHFFNMGASCQSNQLVAWKWFKLSYLYT
jgi:hypothetical protein